MVKIGRNAPCSCGSGKKYKKCCLAKDEEARRSRLEEQDRRELEAKRRAEEENELFEEEYYGEDTDATDDSDDSDDWGDWGDSDEIDDRDERGERGKIDYEMDEIPQDSTAKRRGRRKTPQESPEISDLDQEIVNRWWEEYKKLDTIEEIRQHLEDFLQDHPRLVPNLELHPDMMFTLGDKYIRAGRNAEYIDLLLKMRSQFTDSYLKSFGYHDRDIVAHKIIMGRKDEAASFLNYFKEYPEHDPDNLFKIIEFMMANNCQDMVTDLIQDVYYDVCTCPGIFGGHELIDILVMAYMAPFLKPDFTHADLEELASRLRTIRHPLKKELYDPEFLRQYLERILYLRKGWHIDDCATRNQMIDRYYEVSLNFMGYLHETKGKDWLAAEFYRRMVHRYLVNVVPEGKRPRKTFIFTREKIETTLARTCKYILFLDVTKTMVSLNSLYWFAEYLEETGSIPETERTRIQEWCAELYHQVFPGLLRTNLETPAFQRFPV